MLALSWPMTWWLWRFYVHVQLFHKEKHTLAVGPCIWLNIGLDAWFMWWVDGDDSSKAYLGLKPVIDFWLVYWISPGVIWVRNYAKSIVTIHDVDTNQQRLRWTVRIYACDMICKYNKAYCLLATPTADGIPYEIRMFPYKILKDGQQLSNTMNTNSTFVRFEFDAKSPGKSVIKEWWSFVP